MPSNWFLTKESLNLEYVLLLTMQQCYASRSFKYYDGIDQEKQYTYTTIYIPESTYLCIYIRKDQTECILGCIRFILHTKSWILAATKD